MAPLMARSRRRQPRLAGWASPSGLEELQRRDRQPKTDHQHGPKADGHGGLGTYTNLANKTFVTNAQAINVFRRVSSSC